MFEHLAKLAELGLGLQGDALSVQESRANRQTLGGIPQRTAQHNWQYALVHDPEGQRFLHLADGERVFNFSIGSDLNEEVLRSGAPLPMKRLADLSKKEMGAGTVLSRGALQVHRSTPSEIHATMQDGRRGTTFKLQHSDGGWTFMPCAPKQRSATTAGQFIQALAKKAGLPATPMPKPAVPPIKLSPAPSVTPKPIAPTVPAAPTATLPKAPSPTAEQIIGPAKPRPAVDPFGGRPRPTTAAGWQEELTQRFHPMELMGRDEVNSVGNLGEQVTTTPNSNFLNANAVKTGAFKERGKKERVQVFQDECCPECEYVFPEKCFPRVTNQEDAAQGAPEIYECPKCKGRFIDPEISDERIAEASKGYFPNVGDFMSQRRQKRRDWIARHPDWDKDDDTKKGKLQPHFASDSSKTAAERWKPWIGVDLDGTLAYAPEGKFLSTPGKPIQAMVDRIEKWLQEGKTVKIFTARAHDKMGRRTVRQWLRRSGVPRSFEDLEITDQKDPGMTELWDDRVKQVEKNTGKLAYLLTHYSRDRHEELRPLTYDELEKDRTNGRWEKQPEKAKAYVADRRSFESELHRRLRSRGLDSNSDTSFLYATLDGMERFGEKFNKKNPAFKHTAPLTQDIINRSFFDVVGDPASLAEKNRTVIGQRGLASALRRWREASEAGQLDNAKYMGMTIRPRIEIITPNAIVPTEIKKADFRSNLLARIHAQRSTVNTNPTEGQRNAGNYRKGHVFIQGLDITIENPKGSIRSGVDRRGNSWSIKMKSDYGYIRNHPRSAADGDHVDVFVGQHPDSGVVFVIDQYERNRFDEHKCMVGFVNAKEAKEAYLANYNTGFSGFGDITSLTMKQFRNWLRRGDTGKPLAGQSLADFNKEASLQEILASPWVSSLPAGIVLGGARGALVGGALGYLNDEDRKKHHEANWSHIRNRVLLGAGTGAALGVGIHYGLQALGQDASIKTAAPVLKKSGSTLLDQITAPLWMQPSGAGIALGAIGGAAAGAGINTLRKVKRQVMGEPTEDVTATDGLISGAIAGGGLATVSQMMGRDPSAPLPVNPFKSAAYSTDWGVVAKICNDPSIPTWQQAVLIKEYDRSQSLGIPLNPSQLAAAGLMALAGWLTAKASGFGGSMQTLGAIGGAMMGSSLMSPEPHYLSGSGFYRP